MTRAHLSPQTRAYTKVGFTAWTVVVGSYPDYDGPEPSEHLYGWKPIWIKIANGKMRANWISLTGLTTEELVSLQRLIAIAFDDAFVVAQDLDRQAEEVLLDPEAKEIPMRALASPPPWFEREVPLQFRDPTEPEPEPHSEPWRLLRPEPEPHSEKLID